MDSNLPLILALCACAVFGAGAWWTHRRQIKQARQKLLDKLPLAAIEIAPDGNLSYLNASAAALLDTSPKEALNHPVARLKAPWPERFQQFEDSPGSAARVFEDAHQALVFMDGGESELGRVILIEDRSDERINRDRLAHTHRLASLGQLAAGVAHEIGNPLTSIDSLAQLLPQSEKETQTLIRSQTQRISEIIQSLLTFSKEEPVDSLNQSTSTTQLLDEAVRLFSLDSRHHDIDVQLSISAEGTWQGDAVAMTQVLINLLNNAAQAVADQPLQRLAVESRITGNEWRLSVVDNGPGVPESLRDKLFEPFATGRSNEGGTGLGLALCYGIVQRHRGRIWLDTPGPDEGARFSIRLPLTG